MKRIVQLQNLSKEHHQSLTLAQKAIKIADAQNPEAISELCKEIVNDYPAIWKIHFKIEEDSIFQLFPESGAEKVSEKPYSEISNLCRLLKEEHQTMNGYYEQMKAGDYSVLGKFGTLLKKHTRTEERELFPRLEQNMSLELLNKVLKMSQDYRKID